MIDFEFPELPAWQRAKALMDEKAIGKLRHVVVTWQVENHATRMRLKSWKTNGDDGGGVLGNFVSHCFHYLEYFGGPLANLYAQVFGLPGEKKPSESIVALSGQFASGAALSLSMSAASYLGSGHRVEFYGEDGTLMLVNTAADYMRGFELILRAPAGGETRAHRCESAGRFTISRRAHRADCPACIALLRCDRKRRNGFTRHPRRPSRAATDRAGAALP